MNRFLVVTSPHIPGRTIKRTIGLVRGNAVRARHIGKDILALMRSVVGGELGEYTKLMAETREMAIDRMVDEAQCLGGDAIISTHFATSMIMGGAAELLAIGTAVELEAE